MKAMKLTLQGQTAFFKKPDVNTYVYFTYGNIHKVALLGLLGAILGLKGYNQQTEAEYPEFYSKLKDLEVAIVPISKGDRNRLPGVMTKKVQVFNNSVGYASQEAGGNLIIKEQWLENPVWDVYISEGHEQYSEIRRRLINSEYVYIPYLGKNDHLATVKDIIEVNLEKVVGSAKINSLFLKEEFIREESIGFFQDVEPYYKYEEKLPVELEKEHNQYKLKSFMLTNKKMKAVYEAKLYQASNQIIYFF